MFVKTSANEKNFVNTMVLHAKYVHFPTAEHYKQLKQNLKWASPLQRFLD